jgi:perosamine synthetase
MRRFDSIQARRNANAKTYIDRLIASPNLILPTVAPETVMSWFVFVVRLATEYTEEERNRVIKGLRNHDIGCAPYFPCIHLQPFYRSQFGYKPGDFPIAESVSQRTIALPFFASLTEREIGLVTETLELMISRLDLSRP